MSRPARVLVTALAAAVIAGCAPMVTVENKTDSPLRVVLSASNGRQVLSPAAGSSSTGEVAVGPWTMTVISDEEWREYALATRNYLVEQLEDPDDLSRAEVAETLERLREVSAQLEQFEQADGANPVSCGGTMAEDELTASAVITGEDEEMQVVCTAGKSIQETMEEQRGR